MLHASHEMTNLTKEKLEKVDLRKDSARRKFVRVSCRDETSDVCRVRVNMHNVHGLIVYEPTGIGIDIRLLLDVFTTRYSPLEVFLFLREALSPSRSFRPASAATHPPRFVSTPDASKSASRDRNRHSAAVSEDLSPSRRIEFSSRRRTMVATDSSNLC